MESNMDTNADLWSILDVDLCLLPSELLAYYLYRYRIDLKNKKNTFSEEDVQAIKYYLTISNVGGEDDV